MLRRFLRRAVFCALVVGPFAAAACGGGDNASSGFSEGPDGSGSSSGASSSSGGSSSGSGSSSGTSSSSGSSSGGFGDGGATDGGTFDGTAPDAGQPPTSLVFVHASPSLPSLRLCWAVPGSTDLPFPSTNEMPASNYAGIPVGGAVWLGDALDPTRALLGEQIYAVRALIVEALAPTASCSELICPPGGQHCLMANADYWPVGTIVPDQLRLGTTNIVAIAGCLGVAGDTLASADRCGSAWNSATGNLHLDVIPAPLAADADAGGPLMVQAAQLSPGLQSLEGDAGALVSFGPEGDASTIAQLDQEGDLLPASPVPVPLQGGLAEYGQLGFGVDVQGEAAGGAGHLWMSLAQAQQLVSPAQDPGVYYAGGPYIVAVVGDPNAPHAFGGGDGGYDGKGLHVLVLPTGGQAPP
jgi:hypothetical protein